MRMVPVLEHWDRNQHLYRFNHYYSMVSCCFQANLILPERVPSSSCMLITCKCYILHLFFIGDFYYFPWRSSPGSASSTIPSWIPCKPGKPQHTHHLHHGNYQCVLWWFVFLFASLYNVKSLEARCCILFKLKYTYPVERLIQTGMWKLLNE